ncbi:aldehyde dehydrogenase family protein [Staphylococcus nepalensis]|uniref:aldehyde dehydrogenase family protein n=1 Tax=Staphylococcus nepalensis TaxID=214473 RepID=UPI0031014470
MKYLSDYINGEFINYNEANYVNVINPSTEETIAKVPEGNTETLNNAINTSFIAQRSWEVMPAVERGNFLKKIANGIRDRAGEIINAIISEGGKTYALAETETYFTADYLDYMSEWAHLLIKRHNKLHKKK